MRSPTQKLLTAEGAEKNRRDRTEEDLKAEDRKQNVLARFSLRCSRHSWQWSCSFVLFLVVACSVGIWGQSSSGSQPTSSGNSQKPDTSFPTPAPARPDLSPPRSDRVNASDLGTELGESSSKDTQGDVDAPENDARAHPKSAEAVADEAASTGSTNSVGEFHPWNPHKAGKDVEVGDYYFKRKNYKAAEDRYREALFYKENDAEATFHLALCLQKMERPREALEQYETYLKILPSGPHAPAAHEAIEELTASAKARAAK